MDNNTDEDTSSEDQIVKTMALRKQIESAMRLGAQLVRDSNGLPKKGADFEVLNSYPVFNTFMKKQEERLNDLMGRLTKSIGCAMRVPNVGSSTAFYSECVVEAQDNIAERAATLLDALKKSDRDEIVQVPEVILKAAPTNRKTEAEISTAIRTFSANIGSILAAKFRERREEAAQMVVHEKPQKSYELKIDNSIVPFVSKLKVKHNAIEKKKKGILLIDEDEASGKRNWAGAAEETEEEHPYILEVLHFKVPENQLKSDEPLKFGPLAETNLTMVDTFEKLENLRATLNSVAEFAVDLEHNSTRSYLGLTCLIQISTKYEDFIIDPFPIWEHVGILNDPFTNPKILKVFHGSDSDVLWLQRDFGIHLVNLFDTYVAMKKLNFEKFGLAHLVAKYANVALDKQYQLADWRARPLREAMLYYAREDTHYLLYCYDRLREELIRKGVKDLEEVYEECKELCVKVYTKPIFNSKGYMTEIKVRSSLNSRQDYALTNLYKWRDQVARDEDESPQFVLPNHMLLSLSETLPRDIGGIYACCNPLPYFVKQRQGDIFKILLEARDVKLEKAIPSLKDVDDAHEARGVRNEEMDEFTSLLRSKIDFSHTRFDEERGEIAIEKQVESKEVLRKARESTLLTVLQPPKMGNGQTNVVVVENEMRNEKKCDNIIKKLEEWVTPFECYTIMMKEKEKREAEEEEERRKKAAEEGPKTMFSHHDPTVCRKPVFDEELTNADELKLIAEQNESDEEPKKNDEPTIFDDSRFSEDQILSKKAMKNRIKAAKRNADISTVLGEGTSSKTANDVEIKKKKVEIVEEFDYEKEDTKAFESRIRDKNTDFDPFHQKMRVKNKTKKSTNMRKTANRQGTINYGKK